MANIKVKKILKLPVTQRLRENYLRKQLNTVLFKYYCEKSALTYDFIMRYASRYLDLQQGLGEIITARELTLGDREIAYTCKFLYEEIDAKTPKLMEKFVQILWFRFVDTLTKLQKISDEYARILWEAGACYTEKEKLKFLEAGDKQKVISFHTIHSIRKWIRKIVELNSSIRAGEKVPDWFATIMVKQTMAYLLEKLFEWPGRETRYFKTRVGRKIYTLYTGLHIPELGYWGCDIFDSLIDGINNPIFYWEGGKRNYQKGSKPVSDADALIRESILETQKREITNAQLKEQLQNVVDEISDESFEESEHVEQQALTAEEMDFFNKKLLARVPLNDAEKAYGSEIMRKYYGEKNFNKWYGVNNRGEDEESQSRDEELAPSTDGI